MYLSSYLPISDPGRPILTWRTLKAVSPLLTMFGPTKDPAKCQQISDTLGSQPC